MATKCVIFNLSKKKKNGKKIYAYMCMGIYVYMRICVYVYIRIFIYQESFSTNGFKAYMYILVYIYISMCIYAYMYILIYAYIDIFFKKYAEKSYCINVLKAL